MSSIIQKYIDFSLKSLSKYSKLVFKTKMKLDDIDVILNTYKEIRFYNYLDVDSFQINNVITANIKEKVFKLENLSKYDEKELKIIANIFRNILYLDNFYDDLKINNILNSIKDLYEKLFKKEFVENGNLFSLVKENNKKKIKYLKEHKTDIFYIDYKKVENYKIYNTYLKYNFTFPSIYSEFAIEKVYNSDMIQEQKSFVLYNLVSLRILNEVINYNFKTKYIIDYSFSLLDKKEKNRRLLEIIGSDLCKDKVYIKIEYKKYLENKDYVDLLIKDGFHIVIYFKELVEFTDVAIKKLDIFDFIIVDTNELYEYYSSLSNYVLFVKER